jgi:large subunit ribosomal protein L18
MKRLVGRIKRHKIVRKKISGTKMIPRLSVFRSNKGLFVQLIDDEEGNTLIGMSSSVIKEDGKKTDISYKLGIEFGKVSVGKKYTKVVFDRGGYKFHGRVKAFAEGAKKSGLIF